MSYSITSTVERVLAITELVDLICEQSPRYGTTEWSIYSSYDNSSPGSSSYGALPALARTNRFLSKRALRTLWRRLDSFWPLLRLLPSDLVEVGDSPSYLGEQERDEYEVCFFPVLFVALHSCNLGRHFVLHNLMISFVTYITRNSCNIYRVLKRRRFLGTLLMYL